MGCMARHVQYAETENHRHESQKHAEMTRKAEKIRVSTPPPPPVPRLSVNELLLQIQALKEEDKVALRERAQDF